MILLTDGARGRFLFSFSRLEQNQPERFFFCSGPKGAPSSLASRFQGDSERCSKDFLAFSLPSAIGHQPLFFSRRWHASSPHIYPVAVVIRRWLLFPGSFTEGEIISCQTRVMSPMILLSPVVFLLHPSALRPSRAKVRSTPSSSYLDPVFFAPSYGQGTL